MLGVFHEQPVKTNDGLNPFTPEFLKWTLPSVEE